MKNNHLLYGHNMTVR